MTFCKFSSYFVFVRFYYFLRYLPFRNNLIKILVLKNLTVFNTIIVQMLHICIIIQYKYFFVLKNQSQANLGKRSEEKILIFLSNFNGTDCVWQILARLNANMTKQKRRKKFSIITPMRLLNKKDDWAYNIFFLT